MIKLYKDFQVQEPNNSRKGNTSYKLDFLREPNVEEVLVTYLLEPIEKYTSHLNLPLKRNWRSTPFLWNAENDDRKIEQNIAQWLLCNFHKIRRHIGFITIHALVCAAKSVKQKLKPRKSSYRFSVYCTLKHLGILDLGTQITLKLLN